MAEFEHPFAEFKASLTEVKPPIMEFKPSPPELQPPFEKVQTPIAKVQPRFAKVGSPLNGLGGVTSADIFLLKLARQLRGPVRQHVDLIRDKAVLVFLNHQEPLSVRGHIVVRVGGAGWATCGA